MKIVGEGLIFECFNADRGTKVGLVREEIEYLGRTDL